jgi:DNA ligase 1
VCYLCQGMIAPEFAGVNLGLAEKLAARAVATAAGADAAQVAALVRETGDLGQAAERLLALPRPGAGGRAASLEVADVVRTLGETASWSCWADCLPRPPRWKPATCCAW